MEKTPTSAALEPSGEEKAFVCQQAMELRPFLAGSGGGPVAVVLEKNKGKKGEHFAVTFILIPDKFNIKIRAKGDNLFDVCKDAKDQAKKTLSLIMNQQDSSVRDKQMAHLKKFPYIQ